MYEAEKSCSVCFLSLHIIFLQFKKRNAEENMSLKLRSVYIGGGGSGFVTGINELNVI